MIDIVFISYQFPPENAGGTQRPFHFVKYLREFGINPIVVKLSPESFDDVYDNYLEGESGTDELPPEIKLIDVKSKNLVDNSHGRVITFFKYFFKLTDKRAAGWKTDFIPTVESIISEYSPKAIFVTIPPFSVSGLALQISKKHKLPLILDMRDAWSNWSISPRLTYLHYYLIKKLEYTALKGAEKVIVTSDQTQSDLQKIHPTLDDEKMHLIMNGYDKEIERWAFLEIDESKNYTIGYVGSFYYEPESRKLMLSPWWKKPLHHMLGYAPHQEDWLYRSPEFFFKSLVKLFGLEPKLKKRVTIKFAGLIPDWLPKMVDKNGLQDNVKLLGPLSLKESLNFQESCDALLITSSKVIGGEDFSIAGKTFEYISMKKPIIAFVAEGAQRRFLKETGLALLCNPDDSEESAQMLNDLLSGKIKFTPNSTFLKSLHRRVLTKKLSEVIFDAIGSGNTGL